MGEVLLQGEKEYRVVLIENNSIIPYNLVMDTEMILRFWKPGQRLMLTNLNMEWLVDYNRMCALFSAHAKQLVELSGQDVMVVAYVLHSTEVLTEPIGDVVDVLRLAVQTEYGHIYQSVNQVLVYRCMESLLTAKRIGVETPYRLSVRGNR